MLRNLKKNFHTDQISKVEALQTLGPQRDI